MTCRLRKTRWARDHSTISWLQDHQTNDVQAHVKLYWLKTAAHRVSLSILVGALPHWKWHMPHSPLHLRWIRARKFDRTCWTGKECQRGHCSSAYRQAWLRASRPALQVKLNQSRFYEGKFASVEGLTRVSSILRKYRDQPLWRTSMVRFPSIVKIRWLCLNFSTTTQ